MFSQLQNIYYENHPSKSQQTRDKMFILQCTMHINIAVDIFRMDHNKMFRKYFVLGFILQCVNFPEKPKVAFDAFPKYNESKFVYGPLQFNALKRIKYSKSFILKYI